MLITFLIIQIFNKTDTYKMLIREGVWASSIPTPFICLQKGIKFMEIYEGFPISQSVCS